MENWMELTFPSLSVNEGFARAATAAFAALRDPTIDELSEAITLVQTNKIAQFPVVMFGKEFWGPLVDWFRNTLLENKMIKEEDFDLFHVVDNVDEAVNIIDDFYKKSDLKPNF